jgi:hypothetical protein
LLALPSRAVLGGQYPVFEAPFGLS